MYSTLADRSTNSTDQWAEWTPSGMPSEGAVYEVFVYVPAPNTTSWQMPLVINYLNTSGNWTTNATTIDQNDLSDQWASVGTYRMKPGAYVWTHDATGEAFAQHCGDGVWCQLGVDAVKFVRRGTVYAPDVRYNNGGWTSYVTVRNNGGGLATTLLKFLQSNGTVACATATLSLFAHQSITYSCPSTAVASAIVEASQDMSVVVLQQRASPYTIEAYPGVDNPAAEVRVPIVQRNNNFIYSDLWIQNGGSATTNVTTEFLPAPGYGNFASITWNNRAPGTRLAINTGSLAIGNGSGVFVGSVRITNSAGQPLAVASTQYKDSGGVSQLFETSNTQPAATTLYAPLVQNNNSGNLSGLALSRTGGGTFDVRYYNNSTGVECANQLGLTNNPQIIYPAPPTGNTCSTVTLAKFQAGSTMVANINQLKTSGNATTYAAISTPSKVAIVAKVRRGSGWNDGFVIANFNGVAATVTVKLYNENSALNSTPVNGQSVSANSSLTVLGQLPATFDGSAVITADQPIAVSANNLQSGTGDVLGSYPATHR